MKDLTPTQKKTNGKNVLPLHAALPDSNLIWATFNRINIQALSPCTIFSGATACLILHYCDAPWQSLPQNILTATSSIPTCISVLGFQSGSNNITLSAPVRFTPTPPVRVVNSMMNMDSSALKRSMRVWERKSMAGGRQKGTVLDYLSQRAHGHDLFGGSWCC